MLKFLALFFSLNFLALAANNNTVVKEQAQLFLKSHAEEKLVIENVYHKIMETKVGVIPVQGGKGQVLFVHGIDKLPYYPEWVIPLGHVIERKIKTSFFTWDPQESIRDAAAVLKTSLEGMLRLSPQEDLTVIAHSAGGIVAILAVGHLSLEQQKRIHLHTVASPLYGYRGPKISFLASPVFGKAPLEMGHGFKKDLRKIKIHQCHHWITTDCERDKHACKKLGIYPQTGLAKKPEILPCGNENVTRLTDEDHESAILHVVQKVLK